MDDTTRLQLNNALDKTKLWRVTLWDMASFSAMYVRMFVTRIEKAEVYVPRYMCSSEVVKAPPLFIEKNRLDSFWMNQGILLAC